MAVSKEVIYVVASFEDAEEAHLAPSRLYQYSAGTWLFVDYSDTIQAMALYRAPGSVQRALCVVSTDGHVVFPHDPDRRELIVEKVNPLVRGKRLGRIVGMTQIGDSLYTYGEGGQVYRRSNKGDWSILDPALLNELGDPEYHRKLIMPDGQPIGSRRELFDIYPELYDEYIRRLHASNPNTIIYGLAGLTEHRIFAVGKGGVFFWNGSTFRSVKTDSDEALTDLIIDDDQVIVCGRKGTLMTGNEIDGFQQVPARTGEALFLSMAAYQGGIYLASGASPQGLAFTDLKTIELVTTNLKPEITNVSRVHAVDGVLWVVGGDDIVRFDGTTWTRIGLPPSKTAER